MAVNRSRNMSSEFHTGVVEPSYMHLTPDRCCVENPPVERMGWPTYRQVEQHLNDPFPGAPSQFHEISTRGTDTTEKMAKLKLGLA